MSQMQRVSGPSTLALSSRRFSSTFDGFMSRWMISCSCRCAAGTNAALVKPPRHRSSLRYAAPPAPPAPPAGAPALPHAPAQVRETTTAQPPLHCDPKTLNPKPLNPLHCDRVDAPRPLSSSRASWHCWVRDRSTSCSSVPARAGGLYHNPRLLGPSCWKIVHVVVRPSQS